MNKKIAILGAGSWAIAIANLLASNGFRATMWEFDPEELRLLKREREHPRKLPGIKIDDSIALTNDISKAMENSRAVVNAVPTQKVAGVCHRLLPVFGKPDVVVSLSKGIEEGTLRSVSQVIADEWAGIDKKSIVALSGPSHAEEVARQLPTSVVVAGNEDRCRQAQEIFSNPVFRVYRSSDLVGVELGGSLKNVIAIAAGITQGLGFGDNTRSALITRGLVEINRLAIMMGAESETLAGLSGVGDLIATCTSKHSRNHYVGYHIGRGQTLEQVLAGMVMVAEGVTTCRSMRELARRHDVEMPISEAVYSVLFEGLSPGEAVTNLMTRPLKAEEWR